LKTKVIHLIIYQNNEKNIIRNLDFPFFLTVKAQTPKQVVNTTGVKYVYVGSLTAESTSSSNSQKIIIKILGGSWFSDSNGETNYYISNRGGLSIRQVSLGASVGGLLVLKAYQNGNNTDFYIVPDAGNYSSFAITSYSYGYTLTPQFINITEQTTLPSGTDITSTMSIIPITVTDGEGRVGIGTATPAEALSVNGKIRSKEIKVETNGWSDFVFAKDYVLPTLQETEKHIKEKGHLSGIPSAAEVEKNGIELGDMNKKLLQKIEELTLYLIEMKKENEVQNKAISSLKTSNEVLISRFKSIQSNK